MDTILNNTKLMSSDNELVSDAAVTRLKRLISTGNALVFVGAGFSIESKKYLWDESSIGEKSCIANFGSRSRIPRKNKCRCRAYNGN
ncbi:hypothetical protein OS11_14910 [Dickeya oryzae]